MKTTMEKVIVNGKVRKDNFSEYLETIDYKGIEKDLIAKSYAYKITLQDPEDLQQTLKIYLWQNYKFFKSEKSSYRTFANKQMKQCLFKLYKEADKEFFKDEKDLPVRYIKNVFDYQETIASNEGEDKDWNEKLIDDIDFKRNLEKVGATTLDKEFIKLRDQGFSFEEIGKCQNFKTGKVIREGKKMSGEAIRKRCIEIDKKIQERKERFDL